MTEPVDLREFLAGFLAEADEILRGAHACLLAIEASARKGASSPRAVRDLYRALHTLKGLAGMVGVEPIVDLAHAMETVVRLADRQAGLLSTAAVDLCLQGLQAIEDRVRQLAADKTVSAAPAALLAALAAWLLFALPCNLAAGNILSLTMPYHINPGRIAGQPGSQSSRLTAMLIQAGTLAVGAAVESLCWSLEKQWLAVPILLVLAVAAFLVWKRVLGNVDAMALERRDELIATLMKVQ